MKLENNLESDDVKKLVFRLAIPSMLAQFVSVFYSIVDRMYIGNIRGIGEKALAGVGVCGPVVTLISSFAFLVGVGNRIITGLFLCFYFAFFIQPKGSGCYTVSDFFGALLSVFVFFTFIKPKLERIKKEGKERTE